MKRIILCIGLGVLLSFLFVFNVVAYFHSRTISTSGIAVILMLGIWTPIQWALVFKIIIDRLNKRLVALDEKLNRLLEQQER